MLQRSFLHPWEGTLTSFTAVGIKYNSIDVHITCPAMFTLPVLPCSHYLYCHVHITCTAMFTLPVLPCLCRHLLFLKVLYKQFVSFGNKVK